jgi:hypothetical protein
MMDQGNSPAPQSGLQCPSYSPRGEEAKVQKVRRKPSEAADKPPPWAFCLELRVGTARHPIRVLRDDEPSWTYVWAVLASMQRRKPLWP